MGVFLDTVQPAKMSVYVYKYPFMQDNCCFVPGLWGNRHNGVTFIMDAIISGSCHNRRRRSRCVLAIMCCVSHSVAGGVC